MRNYLQLIEETAEAHVLNGTARRVVFPMEYQLGSRVLFYAKTMNWGAKSNSNPAAAVFEETAGATLELTRLESLVGSRS